MKVSAVVSWIFKTRPEHELQKGGLTEIMNLNWISIGSSTSTRVSRRLTD